ncbi:MAG: hypothetical protein JNL58_31115 [Planctomyces sp.]|nr:hypothetical protein [Planctomyces sp.]
MSLKNLVMLGSLLACLCACVPSQAGVIFQTNAPNGGSPSRLQFGIATRITVASSITIGGIGVELDLHTDGALNYFIFNSNTGALLFQSGAQAFADNGMGFKDFTSMNFTLNAGTTYAIGATTNVYADYAYIVPGGKTMGGITSLGGNQNANGFLSPTLGLTLAGTDGSMRLFSPAPAAAVPEPASVLVWGTVAVGAAFRRLRRRKADSAA